VAAHPPSFVMAEPASRRRAQRRLRGVGVIALATLSVFVILSPEQGREEHLQAPVPQRTSFLSRQRVQKGSSISRRLAQRAYIPDEFGNIHYPATPDPGVWKWLHNWRKPDGFLPGTAGQEFKLGDKDWDPRLGGGHPDFDVSIGPYGENLDYYGKWDPLDPENWLLGLDRDPGDHMIGIPRPEQKSFFENILDKLMFWKEKDTHDYSVHYLRPGGEGSDDYRVWLEEDENGFGPGDVKYIGYNKTHKNGTKEFIPAQKNYDLSFWREMDNGTFEYVHVPPGESRPHMYDNWWIRFYMFCNRREKIVRTPAGAMPTELGTYGPISHLLGKDPKDDDFRDPRWSAMD